MKDRSNLLRRSFGPNIRATRAHAGFGAGLNAPHLYGHCALFDSESQVMWAEDVLDDYLEEMPFVEVIDAGAFDRTLSESPDVVALFNHDSSAVLGRTTSGTLKLHVNVLGLYFDCAP